MMISSSPGILLPWIYMVHFILFKVFMPSYVTVNNGAEEKSLTIENLCLKCIKDKPCKQVNLSRCFANIPLMLVLIDPSSSVIVYDLFEEPMGQIGAVPTMCLLLSLPSLHPFLFSRTHGSWQPRILRPWPLRKGLYSSLKSVCVGTTGNPSK